jgi:large subunit ribosomal protein L24
LNAGPGVLTLNASGPAGGDLKIDGKLSAAGLEAAVSGTAMLFIDTPSAAFNATITQADAAPLRGGAPGALPVTFTGKIGLRGKELTINNIAATAAGSALHGKLSISLASPRQVQGEIEADNLDASGLVAAAIGMPAGNGKTGWSWSSEPFSGGVMGDYTGHIALQARRAELLPRLTAREFRATLQLRKDELSFNDMTGDVGGGRFTGQLAFRTADDGLKAHGKMSLTGADTATLLGAGARPPVSGSLGFSAEVEGTGMSPAALIGSLQGTGKIALSDAQFAGLDPRAFDAVTRAIDQGMAINATRISELVSKALETGHLSVKRVEANLTLSAGQMRLGNVRIDSQDAALSMAGNFDLTDGTIDGRLVLSGAGLAAGSRPEIYIALQGPVTSPTRSIDVSALSGWLTLRSIDNQSRQLREIENAQPKPGAPKPKSEMAPMPGQSGRGEASIGSQN